MTMANTEVFFDSNVVAYMFSGDIAKAAISEELLALGGAISVQVLNECALVLLRRYRASWPQIEAMSTTVRASCIVVPMTEQIHVQGLANAKRYKFHIYDSMILAAAQLAGCTTLYTEDMHNGQVIGGLTIRNPYKAR